MSQSVSQEMYNFVRTPRWIATHLGVIVIASLFALAGFWQLDRLDQTRERNALIEQRRATEVVDVADLDETPAAHRQVRATGIYDYDEEVIIRGRPLNGLPGDHRLTPLILEDGNAVLVDRGFAATGVDDQRVAGDVEVTGVLVPSEAGTYQGPRQRVTELTRIDVDRIAQQLPYQVRPEYLLLASQEPTVTDPVPVPPAELSEGSHLIYAIQWFAFVAIGVIGYGAFLRREAQRRA